MQQINGVDMIEVIEPHELKRALAAISPATLGDGMLEVGFKSEAARVYSPHMVTIRGALHILGEYHVWEVELDLRGVRDADSVLELAKALNQVIDKAADHVSKGGGYVQAAA